ncbi:hypothetical protein MNBD_GAMMA22-2841 [hydrothermal vent metagenome]|uniref:Zinc-finger domain-containing protein n=1 Tax=hydrothermal vent metagenome TaxID=652676 RepID=A0A3B1A4N7_9ZZZZ
MKLSCKQVSIKLSELQDTKLGFTDRFFMRIHLLMCKSCQQIEQQFSLLTKPSHKIKHKKQCLSDDARQRIIDKLKEKH